MIKLWFQSSLNHSPILQMLHQAVVILTTQMGMAAQHHFMARGIKKRGTGK